jgi:hypothetical protein
MRTSVLLLAIGALASPASGQTVTVDATPGQEENRFVPNLTLGAGIDRLSSAAIDKIFSEGPIQQASAIDPRGGGGGVSRKIR